MFAYYRHPIIEAVSPTRGSASKSARGKLPALSSHECAPPPKLSNAALQFDARGTLGSDFALC